MSTNTGKFLKQILLGVAGVSAWSMGITVSYDNSILAGGNQRDLALAIVHDVSKAVDLSPACSALAFDVVERGLRARAAAWMPTHGHLMSRESEAVDHYEQGECPVSSYPVIAFALADVGGQWEDQRARVRGERW
jgi:hypothetical protein